MPLQYFKNQYFSFKLLTENHKETEKSIHHKLKEYTMQHNSVQ